MPLLKIFQITPRITHQSTLIAGGPLDIMNSVISSIRIATITITIATTACHYGRLSLLMPTLILPGLDMTPATTITLAGLILTMASVGLKIKTGIFC